MTAFEEKLIRQTFHIVGSEIGVRVTDEPGSQKVFLDYQKMDSGTVALKKTHVLGVVAVIEIELYKNFPHQQIKEILFTQVTTRYGLIPSIAPCHETRITITRGDISWQDLVTMIHQVITNPALT